MTVFLDYNATSPLRRSSRESIINILGPPINPSSVHFFGRQSKAFLENSRQQVASIVGSKRDEVIFTSGGTESNVMVLSNAKQPLISSIEHDAVIKACSSLNFVVVNNDGRVDLNQLEDKLKNLKPDFLSIMWANNETGIIQPIKEIVEIAKNFEVHIHCDAVQAFGKIPINFKNSGLHSMAISSHKIGGPAGVGALILSEKCNLEPLIKGGGQEKGRRSGTENTLGIVGFGFAAEETEKELSSNSIFERQQNFEIIIKKNLKDVIIIGESVSRLPNTTALFMPYLNAETQVIALDIEGFAVSAGSACSSGKVKTSHVLKAMGADWAANNTIRISSGWKNTDNDLEKLAESYIGMYKRSIK